MKKFQTQTQPLALCGRANFLWGRMTDGQIVIGDAAADDDADCGRAELVPTHLPPDKECLTSDLRRDKCE